MAGSKTPPLDLRAELATVNVRSGPKGEFEIWFDGIDPAIRTQLEDIMRDPVDVTGHTKIVKLINERLGGPKFHADKIAGYRTKLAARS
jgi:hypothetical protein